MTNTTSLPLRTVDVFGADPYVGNPVAVVHDADHLSDVQMAAIARWTNLSETTFLLRPTIPDADYRVRIFTASFELPFAGHPTLGTCRAWLDAGGVPDDAGCVVQECGVGRVLVRRSDDRLAFAAPDLIRSGPVDESDLAEACSAIGLSRADVIASEWVDNGPGWLGILVESVAALRGLTPTRSELKIGVAALTPDRETAIEVRAFFPGGGRLEEDPVTGSLNAALGQWLVGAGRLETPYVAAQGAALGRRGRVFVDSDGADLWIGGAAVTLIEGRIRVS